VLLPELICCPHCDQPLASSGHSDLACVCGKSVLQRVGDLYLPADFTASAEAERAVRDAQAGTYLQHAKFPTQLASFRDWLQRAVVQPRTGGPRPVALDLGCGPGPYTSLLLQAGFDVLAIDVSANSLAINAASCPCSREAGSAYFVQYDLNQLVLRPGSVDIVLMADFIQHLGGRQQRERILGEVTRAMRPGAHFYLSFFNLNLKHYLKGDVHGSFAGGAIRYERLTLRNMLMDLPGELKIDMTQPLNVFHTAGPDRLAAWLPGVF
jgi:SAM-dependent methyltransferase